MAQTINTNIASLNAQRNLNSSQGALQTSLERLSSGFRINNAKDDAAGLAITERMTSQIRGLAQATRNANDAISVTQTAEGGLKESSNILQRMRELAVQSANDTNSDSDRANLQKEVSQLQSELNRLADSTTFNGKNLLDGSFTGQKFQIGANANESIGFSINSARATTLGEQLGKSITNVGAGLAVAADTSGGNTVAAQNITVNGSTGSKMVALTGNESAKAIADLVNEQSGSTGVTASAQTSVTLDNVAADGTVSFTLQSSGGGSAAAISAGVTTTDLTNLADAVNAQSAETGVTATLSENRDAITLENAEGEDILVSDADNTGVAAAAAAFDTGGQSLIKTDGATGTANDSIVVGGQVSFQSDKSFTTTSDTGNTVVGAGGVTSALSSVAQIDLSSQDGSNSALSVIDKALGSIATQRADLGALQNRFESTISNLQNVSENTSAARSRIRDADFASETAEMTRNQILQQAGTAMLAQANSLPQGVLSLLR
ncbi:Flagellin [Nitrosococcus oceani ATCC 19707]|uniref:Flagellin n=1 Tax=Nitrosococcus oceani (strain ATCC 19707 / BCRC 17464 / JCM 30415 / NCIMB 11848 / C-107) TaxID=323261 RepID=Q3J8M1_NITOC|nr:flagellin [Nitrosococcus oceani]ABA58825.1 Flagellin [Nitrosococcus oceani ATCC 19707]GEM19084.1 flagellin [Nitrosococcus oceani]